MKNIFFVLLLICFVGWSCNPRYYVPNTQNVPLIDSKGQISLSLAGNGNQVEIQGAYGLSSNCAAQVNMAFYIPKDLDNGDGGSGKLFELGLGYYRPVGNSFLFETYALFGIGTMENHFPSTHMSNPNTSATLSSNLFRSSLQPVLGFKKKYYSVAVSSRFSSLNYANYKGSLIYDNEDQEKYLKAHRFNFLVEPALTIRLGAKNLKFQIQVMKSLNLSDNKFKQDDGLISFGVNYKF
ncbi:MAG: hypothetical protein ABIO44_00535 [Saprospiraceae bacterium]